MGTAISFFYYLRYIAIISLIISIFPIVKAVGFKRINDIIPILEEHDLYTNHFFASISIILIVVVFNVPNILVEKKYESTLTDNKILSVEIENQYYYDNETLKQFYPKELKRLQISTERLKNKKKLYGCLHLENNEILYIKLIGIEQSSTDTIITYKVISRQFPLVEKEVGSIQSNIINY
ncbi:hypothetical protein [Epilithonimonas sp. UC225_85]|uniref:hypothetical protein n=1 Tax=Epilithonimonas sp. UC225_85 TaxID=3350167 RepID=UPI0036D236F7